MRGKCYACLLSLLLLLLLLATPTCGIVYTPVTDHVAGPESDYPWPLTEDEPRSPALEDDLPGASARPGHPLTHQLAEKVWSRLAALAQSAHLPQPRLGLAQPLDPLHSASTLKYLHEGDLLRLRLLLDEVTLEGLNSLSVQEVSFKGADSEEDEFPPAFRRHTPGQVRDWLKDDLVMHHKAFPSDWNIEQAEESPTMSSTGVEEQREVKRGRGSKKRPRGQKKRPRPPATAEGVVRVAFTQVRVRAKYQVRGSAGGFLTFRENGDLDLTAPTIFLTTRLNLTLPHPPSHRRRTQRHARVKVLWLRSDVTISTTTLLLQPEAYPPEWVRQQVQTKLEELSSDLSHGHGAVRLLLRRWGKLLKKLIQRTARAITK
ncbi:uncharacterized protein [Procambarus clarkii]|uniref:uncharacterized protein n=1 Tax=Procambarus clarkii TaxID=6728 RepID=UPI0037441DB7